MRRLQLKDTLSINSMLDYILDNKTYLETVHREGEMMPRLWIKKDINNPYMIYIKYSAMYSTPKTNKFGYRECQLYIVDGGVWQYRFDHTHPLARDYTSLEKFLRQICSLIERKKTR